MVRWRESVIEYTRSGDSATSLKMSAHSLPLNAWLISCTVPKNAGWPPGASMSTLSHNLLIYDSEWVTTITTRPASASWRNMVITVRSSAGSRPEVGSSRISSSGSVSSSIAVDTRLRWPPDSLSMRFLRRDVSSSSLSTLSMISARSALVEPGRRSLAAYSSAASTESLRCTTSSCGTNPIRLRNSSMF